jgi:hypothetical protein
MRTITLHSESFKSSGPKRTGIAAPTCNGMTTDRRPLNSRRSGSRQHPDGKPSSPTLVRPRQVIRVRRCDPCDEGLCERENVIRIGSHDNWNEDMQASATRRLRIAPPLQGLQTRPADAASLVLIMTCARARAPLPDACHHAGRGTPVGGAFCPPSTPERRPGR